METRTLPHTTLEVSRLCMGTMTFGSQTEFSEAQRMISRCLDTGVNFFDTANVYNQGKSEEILGRVIQSRRRDVILASKVRGAMGEPPQYRGLSRKAMRKAIDDTLRRLQTDYLDIYYLHQPDYDSPIEETLQTLEDLRREGKIRYAGSSNYSGWQLCEILWICEKNGCQSPWISQPMYNLLARGIEQEYLPFTKRFQVAVVCYNPLAGGLLAGKHNQRVGPLPGTRFDGNEMYLNRYWHAAYFEAVEELRSVATSCGRTLVELALRWLIDQDHVDSMILGASRLEQLEENLRAVESPPLEPAVWKACDAVWEKLRGPTPKYNR